MNIPLFRHTWWTGFGTVLLGVAACCCCGPTRAENASQPSKEFEIRGDRAYLGGQPLDLWGIRCANALMSQTTTERHVRNLDNFCAHGINLIGVYLQGSNGGWPNPDAGRNAFEEDGPLKPAFARRLEWLCREADARGMVVLVGLFSPRKDQEFPGEPAIRRAVEAAAQFFAERKLNNVFVDIMHEFNHPDRIAHEIFREPDGAAKKQKLTAWFRALAPNIEVGVCPTYGSSTADAYPEMQVRLIQKRAMIPSDGFVVNVEMQREDEYDDEGVFASEQIATMLETCERYRKAPNAVLLFHAAYVQGIGGRDNTGPNPEMGGYGTSSRDRGVRFYFDWVRTHIGRYEYPRHIRD